MSAEWKFDEVKPDSEAPLRQYATGECPKASRYVGPALLKAPSGKVQKIVVYESGLQPCAPNHSLQEE